jgi:hypothetical protein
MVRGICARRYTRGAAKIMNTAKQWLRSLAWWVLGNVKPSEDDVDAALRRAFLRAGLNQDIYQQDFDLRSSGKLHEVLLHASDDLGNPLRTVSDVKALLR